MVNIRIAASVVVSLTNSYIDTVPSSATVGSNNTLKFYLRDAYNNPIKVDLVLGDDPTVTFQIDRDPATLPGGFKIVEFNATGYYYSVVWSTPLSAAGGVQTFALLRFRFTSWKSRKIVEIWKSKKKSYS